MSRTEWALLAGLFLASFFAVLLTTNSYGPTYDEPHYASAGLDYAKWWVRLGRGDFGALSPDVIEAVWRRNHEHPPLQKCASGISSIALGKLLPGVASIRLPSALWFALAVCAIYLFTRGTWGRRGALFSALAFATMPRIVAHAHFVALDMPVTAWFFITTALVRAGLRKKSWPLALSAGIAFGLALLSKMNAFFLPLLLLPWGLIWYRGRWPKLVVPLLVIGPGVFLLGWPWLWVAPAAHFGEYLAFHFRHAAYNVWYLGKLHQYAPWHYPFVMTAVSTPAAVLALAIAGAARCWPRRNIDPDRALLLFGLLVTILPSAFPSSPKYNGVRLFLPAFPFLAALSGGGFAWLQLQLVRLLSAKKPVRGLLSALVGVALGTALLSPSARAVSTIHPYQLSYYNALAGGTEGATRRGFETIYWGQVFKEAPEFLDSIAEANPRVLIIPSGCIYLLTMQQDSGLLNPNVQFTGDQQQAGEVGYVMFQMMQSDFTDLCWNLVRSEPPAYAFAAEKTPLLVAYDRRAVADALDRLDR